MTSPARIATGLYWDRAWALVEGCTAVSPGCRSCWAAAQAHIHSFASNEKIHKTYHRLTDEHGHWNGTVRVREDLLDLPLHVKKPTTWAVWTDLFHPSVPYPFINDVFYTMSLTPWHHYLVLTKRPERMAEFIRNNDGMHNWPLPNVLPGVTVCNQAEADAKLPVLLSIDTPHRWVSVEPILGPVDLDGMLQDHEWEHGVPGGLGWVVCGAETGPGARPAHPDWFRSLRDQCKAAGVPFFFKGWGEWLPDDQVRPELGHAFTSARFGSLGTDGTWIPGHDSGLFAKGPTKWPFGEIPMVPGVMCMYRVGRAKAGHLLDGVEHRELPEGMAT